MKQTVIGSIVETSVGLIIGFIVSLLLQMYVITPLFNLPVTAGQNTVITLIFTVVSFIRGVLVRRAFNHYLHRESK